MGRIMLGLATMLTDDAALDANCQRADILGHLQRLLSSRVGTSSSAPTYGCADLDNIVSWMAQVPQTAPLIERSVVQTIEQHEPRLHNVCAQSPFVLHATSLVLSLCGRLQPNGGAPDVFFEVHVLPTGQLRVRS
jgi:type VI secretion system lysozyme-like protein